MTSDLLRNPLQGIRYDTLAQDRVPRHAIRCRAPALCRRRLHRWQYVGGAVRRGLWSERAAGAAFCSASRDGKSLLFRKASPMSSDNVVQFVSRAEHSQILYSAVMFPL